MKRLDQKPSNHLNGTTSPKDFLIAEAKDADMAFGITAPGPQRHLQPDMQITTNMMSYR
jgi:hypothetical protein